MVLLDTPFTNDNMTDPTIILFIMTKASTKLSILEVTLIVWYYGLR